MIELTVRDPGGDEASRGRGLAVPINEEHLSEKNYWMQEPCPRYRCPRYSTIYKPSPAS